MAVAPPRDPVVHPLAARVRAVGRRAVHAHHPTLSYPSRLLRSRRLPGRSLTRPLLYALAAPWPGNVEADHQPVENAYTTCENMPMSACCSLSFSSPGLASIWSVRWERVCAMARSAIWGAGESLPNRRTKGGRRRAPPAPSRCRALPPIRLQQQTGFSLVRGLSWTRRIHSAGESRCWRQGRPLPRRTPHRRCVRTS